MEQDEQREMREHLSESIRSHYEPLGHLRQERERLLRGAVELLFTLNELRPWVRQSGSLLEEMEWRRCRDGIQAFLAELGAPLVLGGEKTTP